MTTTRRWLFLALLTTAMLGASARAADGDGAEAEEDSKPFTDVAVGDYAVYNAEISFTVGAMENKLEGIISYLATAKTDEQLTIVVTSTSKELGADKPRITKQEINIDLTRDMEPLEIINLFVHRAATDKVTEEALDEVKEDVLEIDGEKFDAVVIASTAKIVDAGGEERSEAHRFWFTPDVPMFGIRRFESLMEGGPIKARLVGVLADAGGADDEEEDEDEEEE